MNGKTLPRPSGPPPRVRHLNRDQRARLAVPPAYLGWSPATDTREMPAVRRGVPLADQPTEYLHLLDLAPAVAPTRRFGRLRRLAAEFGRVHLPAAWRQASTVCGGIAAGLLALAFLAGTHQLGAVLLAASMEGAH